MSHYEVIDRLILACIKRADFASPLYDARVNTEAKRIASLTGRDCFRVIDGRLQALRKCGRIAYSSKNHRVAGGWSICGESHD